jgi:hypothetical protein
MPAFLLLGARWLQGGKQHILAGLLFYNLVDDTPFALEIGKSMMSNNHIWKRYISKKIFKIA